MRSAGVLLFLLSGCLVEVDYGGTRFRCVESQVCPEGFVCSSDGFCEPPGDASSGASSRRLTVDNRGRAELAGFPVPVFLTAAEIDHAAAGAAGETVRFFDGAQSLLPHQIDTWDPAGTSLVWVRVDLPEDATTEITLSWGDSEAPAALPPADTFDDTFVAVWHLDDDPASGADGAIADDSGADLHGTATADMDAASIVAGPLGGATRFAAGQSASFGDLDPFDLPIYTWTAHLRADAAPVIGSGNAQPIFNADDQFNFSWDHNSADFAVGAAHRDAGGFVAAQIATPVSGETWYLLGATYDGASLSVYLDGALESAAAIGAPVPAAGPLSLGNDPAVPNFSGALDEVRIANVARPPDWFAAYAAAVRGELVEFSEP